ncbi:uncharacterized protein LOC121377724 [Gigantopelta aegis]|uniref:uncharacterized protein LOC121377724 n=1 Tax=Gigantopelta aegis TaxID=1735272 RepID=UPI001B88C899|nr:uncharacterized protein LOC121377724 [Gigantopelta aegis]
MKCRQCNREKLRQEFPPEDLTEDCMHPRFYCMRCVIAKAKENEKCPHPSCDQPVPFNSDIIKLLQHTLAEMFTVYTVKDIPSIVTEASVSGTIRVSVLNGDSTDVLFNSTMTVLQLKEQIKTELGHEVQKQKLLWSEKELKVYGDDGHYMKLGEYNMQPNETIHLVVLMFAVPDRFDHVTFDLYWGYPEFGSRFLDASCLLFNKKKIIHVVDYRRRPGLGNAVTHSGDAMMDDANRIGHQTIDVHLKKLPTEVTHLFFILSAFLTSSLETYPNPSLKFFEASDPDKDLCKTTFTHAKTSQAVVMCSMSRSSAGWEIYESGKLSAGNAANYRPLVINIRKLMDEGY